MPTGYTAAIKDGITFEQFVWSCARGMGALVMMRDEPNNAPIPDRFEPSDYNEKELEKARLELARLQALTIEQVQTEGDADYAKAVQRYAKRKSERQALRDQYNAMLAKVVQWVAPTDEHEGFKEFMSSQLRDSIEFDCDERFDKEPKKQKATTWHNLQIAEARRSIAYHEKAHAEEIERVERRNTWLAELRKSVSASEPPTARNCAENA